MHYGNGECFYFYLERFTSLLFYSLILRAALWSSAVFYLIFTNCWKIHISPQHVFFFTWITDVQPVFCVFAGFRWRLSSSCLCLAQRWPRLSAHCWRPLASTSSPTSWSCQMSERQVFSIPVLCFYFFVLPTPPPTSNQNKKNLWAFCVSVIFGLDHKNQFKSQQWKGSFSASATAVIENLHLRMAYGAVMDFHCVIQSGKHSPLALRVHTPSEQALTAAVGSIIAQIEAVAWRCLQLRNKRNKCWSSTELMSLQQIEHSCLRAATCSGDSSRGMQSVDRLLMIATHVAAIKEQFPSTSGTKRGTWRRACVCANDVTRVTALLVINTSKSSTPVCDADAAVLTFNVYLSTSPN